MSLFHASITPRMGMQTESILGVPTKLRSTVWERAVGNGLALSKSNGFLSFSGLDTYLTRIFHFQPHMHQRLPELRTSLHQSGFRRQLLHCSSPILPTHCHNCRYLIAQQDPCIMICVIYFVHGLSAGRMRG